MAMKPKIVGAGAIARTCYPLNFQAGTVAVDESQNPTNPAGREQDVQDICRCADRSGDGPDSHCIVFLRPNFFGGPQRSAGFETIARVAVPGQGENLVRPDRSRVDGDRRGEQAAWSHVVANHRSGKGRDRGLRQ